jgi:hypothetical protein
MPVYAQIAVPLQQRFIKVAASRRYRFLTVLLRNQKRVFTGILQFRKLVENAQSIWVSHCESRENLHMALELGKASKSVTELSAQRNSRGYPQCLCNR